MSHREALRDDPTQFDFFAVMREFERSAGRTADPAAAPKPRIGESSVVADEVIRLGQDPFLEFPASTVVDYRDGADGVPRLKARFLGYFGPQGALPITTTVEALQWSSQRDESFEDFTNIIANRFLQLFFRAWADARPIVQADRPADDRFFRYVGGLSGAGTEAYADRDTMPDIAKVSFAGLTGSTVKSAVRLLQLIETVLKVEVEIVERVGSWLVFEPSDQMALGTARSVLGVDAALGLRSYSINDKIRIRIKTRNYEQYRRLLPSGDLADRLTDIVFYYLGHRYEFDVELALDARQAPAARLGVAGELGWTSWMTPPRPPEGETRYLNDARFDPMERRRTQRAEA